MNVIENQTRAGLMPGLSPIFAGMISPIENKAYIAGDMTASFNPDKQHTLGSAVTISGTVNVDPVANQ